MKQFCNCGGIILADTEDWNNPLCYSCFMDTVEKANNYQALLAEANNMRETLVKYSDFRFYETEIQYDDITNPGEPVLISKHDSGELAKSTITQFDKFSSEIKERE